MDSHIKKINRDMTIGWFIIVGVLFVSYTLEVFKGERTVPYLIIFLLATVIPAIFSLVLYLKKPYMKNFCYVVVCGYFIMYMFVLITGKTALTFTYILPFLSMMVLYHNNKLILSTGIATIIANIILIIYKFHIGSFNIENSSEAEIQIALLILCYGGSYAAAKLYDEITRQNKKYNEQIQTMTVQTITTIANTLEAKDTYSEGHSRRVAVYSAQLAEKLGLSDEEIRNIHTIALLHDIGKIGIPDSVLNKPGRLTDDEFALMKQHTVFGSDILKDIGMIPGIDIGTKYHHERYDGKGYPDGLKGDNIPYIARIIAVADSYDAMTSDRVYRKRLESDQVISELEKGKGTQFDPFIAQTMVLLIKNGQLFCEEEHFEK